MLWNPAFQSLNKRMDDELRFVVSSFYRSFVRPLQQPKCNCQSAFNAIHYYKSIMLLARTVNNTYHQKQWWQLPLGQHKWYFVWYPNGDTVDNHFIFNGYNSYDTLSYTQDYLLVLRCRCHFPLFTFSINHLRSITIIIICVKHWFILIQIFLFQKKTM